MNETKPKNPLPKPRLILRVGGMGNRKFGTENGIAEDADGLQRAARRACVEVWEKIEKILGEIHAEDRPENARHHWPEWPPKWKTHWLAWLMVSNITPR